jgi:UDP-N-acetyl-2-amino-2-deoxyglucuronate dehydrogenase
MSEPEPTFDDPEPVWAVYRIDDNANVFRVRGGLTRAEADRLVAEFEARGHKQMYWAEQDPGNHVSEPTLP